jgi:hypothetical protein
MFTVNLIFRQQSKEGLAKSASSITENLMSIAKMMESQVQQSRNNTEVLSKYLLPLAVILMCEKNQHCLA